MGVLLRFYWLYSSFNNFLFFDLYLSFVYLCLPYLFFFPSLLFLYRLGVTADYTSLIECKKKNPF